MLSKAERDGFRVLMETNEIWRTISVLKLCQSAFDDLDTKDEEIARITAQNTQQAHRMIHLTVLAVGCDKHPAYRRKRPPTWPCETCKLMWEADRALKEMASPNQIVADVARVLESQDADKQFKELDEFFAGFAKEEEKSGG